MDQPDKVANPARGQLNRENEYFPVPVRARKYDLARRVRPSRPASACSFSTLRLNLLLSRGVPPDFRGGSTGLCTILLSHYHLRALSMFQRRYTCIRRCGRDPNNMHSVVLCTTQIRKNFQDGQGWLDVLNRVSTVPAAFSCTIRRAITNCACGKHVSRPASSARVWGSSQVILLSPNIAVLQCIYVCMYVCMYVLYFFFHLTYSR